MRFVVTNRMSKDAIGSMDNLASQYRCKILATNYLSEELYLLAVTGRKLFRVESTDELVIAYTDCIIRIVCHILNIDLEGNKPKGTITSNDIMDGKVDGTYHKELKEFNEQFAEAHPEIQIDTNPMNNLDYSGTGVEVDDDMAVPEPEDYVQPPVDSIMQSDIPKSEEELEEVREMAKEVDALNYGGVMPEDDVKLDELKDENGDGVPDIMENPDKKEKRKHFGRKKRK